MSQKLKQHNCPTCNTPGTLFIIVKLIAKPMGTWSLSGAQMKTSAYEAPVIVCSTPGCMFEHFGKFDGNDHATFTPFGE